MANTMEVIGDAFKGYILSKIKHKKPSVWTVSNCGHLSVGKSVSTLSEVRNWGHVSGGLI